MRKIERDMIQAIRNGQTWHRDNTTVRFEGGAATVELHNSRIAAIRSDGTVCVTLAGWNTPTTRSRLNAILSVFTRGYGICCHKQNLYLTRRCPGVNHREPIDSSTWITIHSDGCVS